jgi:hypothetical protein
MKTLTYHCSREPRPQDVETAYLEARGLAGPASFWDRAGGKKGPFTQRRDGGRLMADLGPGDHVVFRSIGSAFGSLADWRDTVRLMLVRGATVHFIGEGLVISRESSWVVGTVLDVYLRFVAEFASADRRRPTEPCSQRKRRCSGGEVEIPAGKFDELLRQQKWGDCRFPATTGTRHSYAMLEEPPRFPGNDFRYWREVRYLHTQYPFIERPEGKRLVLRAKPGDAMFVCAGKAFRSVEDMVSASRTLAAIGVSVTITDFGITTLAEEGRALMNLLAVYDILARRRKSEERKERGQRKQITMELPFYLKRRPNGRVVINEFRLWGVLQVLNRREMRGIELEDWMEEQEAEHFGDRKLPRHTINRRARYRWHPDHGTLLRHPGRGYCRSRFWHKARINDIRRAGLEPVKTMLAQYGIRFPGNDMPRPPKASRRKRGVTSGTDSSQPE